MPDPWRIHFFQRDRADDPSCAVPTITFLKTAGTGARRNDRGARRGGPSSTTRVLGRREVGGHARRHGRLLRDPGPRRRPTQPSSLLRPRTRGARPRRPELRLHRWLLEATPKVCAPMRLPADGRVARGVPPSTDRAREAIAQPTYATLRECPNRHFRMQCGPIGVHVLGHPALPNRTPAMCGLGCRVEERRTTRLCAPMLALCRRLICAEIAMAERARSNL